MPSVESHANALGSKTARFFRAFFVSCELWQLSSSGIQTAPSDILSAEVDRLCETLKQRDRQLDEQLKAHASAVKQLLAKVEKRYQHLMGEVGSLKKELGQQRRLLKDLRDSGALVSGSAN